MRKLTFIKINCVTKVNQTGEAPLFSNKAGECLCSRTRQEKRPNNILPIIPHNIGMWYYIGGGDSRIANFSPYGGSCKSGCKSKEKFHMNYLTLGIGLLILVKGADVLVESASRLAKLLKVPSFIVGFLIVAIGTSAPEAAIGVYSGIQGTNLITMGDIVGSSILTLPHS